MQENNKNLQDKIEAKINALKNKLNSIEKKLNTQERLIESLNENASLFINQTELLCHEVLKIQSYNEVCKIAFPNGNIPKILFKK